MVECTEKENMAAQRDREIVCFTTVLLQKMCVDTYLIIICRQSFGYEKLVQ